MKIVLLFIIFSIFLQCVFSEYPGVNGFLTISVMNRLKSFFWPIITKQISNIDINDSFSTDGLSIKNINIQLGIDEKNANLSLSEQTNSAAIGVNNIKLAGKGKFRYQKFIFDFDGDILIHGSVRGIYVRTGVSSIIKDNGTIPQISPQEMKCDIGSDIDIKIDGSILKIVEPIINANILGIKDFIIGKLEEQLNNADMMNNISNEVNKQIATGFPTTIPINDLELGLSTYTAGIPKIWDTGVEIPMEGFFFPLKSGYTKYASCANEQDKIDHNDTLHDANAILQQCSVLSALKALSDNGFSQTLPINQMGIKEMNITLLKNSQSSFDFHPSLASIKTSIYLELKSSEISVTGTADVSGDLVITKKAGLTKLLKSEKQVFYGPQQTFVGINLENAQGVYELSVKVTDIQNLKINAPGMLPFLIDALKAILEGVIKNYNLKKDVTIPQLCFTEGLCMSSLDFVINEGYVKADGSVSG